MRPHRLRAAIILALFTFALAPGAAQAGSWTGYATSLIPEAIVPFDTATNQKTGTPIEFVNSPRDMVISPDGRTAYVIAWNPQRVIPVSLADGTKGEAFPIPNPANQIALAPDGLSAYVISTNKGLVYPLDLVAHSVGDPIEIGAQVWGIAISVDGTKAYVSTGVYPTFPASYAGIAEIDLATGTVTKIGETGSSMTDVGVAPDGSTAYAVAEGLNRLYEVDTASSTISGYLAANSQPIDLALTPDGQRALTSNFSQDTVTSIDLGTGITGPAIETPDYPMAIAVTPDSSKAFVGSNTTSSITPIDLTTNAAQEDIPIGGTSRVVVITPDQPPKAEFTVTDARPGAAVTFDASHSTDRDGSIVTYAWDFGDGDDTVTTSPITSHVYASEGDYQASVTLTDDIGCSTSMVFTGRMASCAGGPAAVATRTISVTTPPDCTVTPDAPGCDGGGGDGDGSKPYARLARIKVTPKVRRAKRGKVAIFTVRIRNTGKATAKGVKLCVKAPRKLVRGAGCRKVGKVAAGKTKRAKLKLKPKRRARRGARIKIRITARARGLTARRAAVRLIVR